MRGGNGFILCVALAVGLLSCGGVDRHPTSSTAQSSSSNELTAADVQTVISNAAAATGQAYTIAVVSRAGEILAVYRKAGASATARANFGQVADSAEVAIALARTGAFFSNNQAPLSSRTVRFISGIHFPPGVADAPTAALYGIENTNRGCPLNVTFLPGQAIQPARSLSGAQVGLGPQTGKADVYDSDATAVSPGGIPLFRNGQLIGGVGVAADRQDVAEFAAFTAAAQSGFGPQPAAPGVVVVEGVSLPFANQTTLPAGVSAGTGSSLASGSFLVAPAASSGTPPEGDLIAPSAGAALSAAEVTAILDKAVATGNITRALIRLPLGSSARFAIAVADLDGHLLGLRRMPDATVFSIDVAAAKARNMVYFNGAPDARDLPGVPPGTAVTNRTISFGAQPLFPPGINGTNPGPFFNLFTFDLANPCTQGHQPANANQNGVVFFPGSVPLYKNGVLVGGLGVSGDGVEQDDFVSAQAAIGYEAPALKQADNISLLGVRLPYLKFPRNPTLP